MLSLNILQTNETFKNASSDLGFKPTMSYWMRVNYAIVDTTNIDSQSFESLFPWSHFSLEITTIILFNNIRASVEKFSWNLFCDSFVWMFCPEVSPMRRRLLIILTRFEIETISRFIANVMDEHLVSNTNTHKLAHSHSHTHSLTL